MCILDQLPPRTQSIPIWKSLFLMDFEAQIIIHPPNTLVCLLRKAWYRAYSIAEVLQIPVAVSMHVMCYRCRHLAESHLGGTGGSPYLVLPCNEVAWEEPLPWLSSFWRGLGVGGPRGSRTSGRNGQIPQG